MKSYAMTVTDGSLDLVILRGPSGNPFINGIEILEILPSAARLAVPAEGESQVPETALIRVYPNPASRGRKLMLEWQQAEDEAISIQLYDHQGRLLYAQEEAAVSQGRKVLPTGNLPAGVYLLQVRGQEWMQTQRVILQD